MAGILERTIALSDAHDLSMSEAILAAGLLVLVTASAAATSPAQKNP